MIDRLRQLLQWPLREQDRRPLFLGCATVLLAVAALAAVRDRDPIPTTQPRPVAPATAAPAEPAPEAQAAVDPSSSPVVERVRDERREVDAAERVARRFLRRYLAYAYGQRQRSGVEGTATPRVARALANLRPRVPARVARLRPRVARLQSEALGGGRRETLAFVEDGERRYALPVRLARSEAGWRVIGLGG